MDGGSEVDGHDLIFGPMVVGGVVACPTKLIPVSFPRNCD